MSPRPALASWPHWPLALVGLYAAMVGLWLVAGDPIAQDPAYHAFADTRRLLGIPRAGDVLSNAALLAAGLAGLRVLGRRGAPRGVGARAPAGDERTAFTVFFAAVALTALGSAYYHWAPDNARLVWDRLPLSLVAAAIPVLVLAERAPLTAAGRRVLAAWLAWAPLTVVYWIATEAHGVGDLRPYAAVQAAAIVGSAALLVLLPARHTGSGAYGAALALYMAAKAGEHWDAAIFAATGWLSGHSLKHLLAAAAVAVLAGMLAVRTRHGVGK